MFDTREKPETAPGRDLSPEDRTMTPWTALLVMIIALVLGALLNARPIAAMAPGSAPPFLGGVVTSLADGLVELSERLLLDRPRSWIDGTLRPSVEPDDRPSPTSVFVPTPSHRARVLVAGDSLVDPFGPALVNRAEDTGVLVARWEVEYSSGLTRPQLFDWASYLLTDLEREPADIVVFMVGANDASPIATPVGPASTGTPEWEEEYGRRVGELMGLLSERVATVYWVGQPIARSDDHSARMAVLNEIYRGEAERYPGVRYVDSWALFEDSRGRYADYLPDDRGRVVLMRQGDGIHLTRDGADRLAHHVLEAIRLDWEIRP
jgi:uncharacterized protein